EFKRSTLEVLRQPLEDGRVTVSRAAGSMTFPAECMVVAAMNPCPCGYYGDPKRECRCSPKQVETYRNRISGPLLDRIDIHIEVPAVEYQQLSSKQPGEASVAIRERIAAAREVQRVRFGDQSRVRCNARMTSKQHRLFCRLDEEADGLLQMAMTQLHLSARAYDRILKVARTIADLEQSEIINATHIGEAVQYRTLDRNLWA